MKLIELLANELSAWPEQGPGCNYCVANSLGEVFFGNGNHLKLSQAPEDHETARVTRAHWNAARWTGEGLPPVGIECEQAPRGVAEHAREVLWRKVRIIAHVEDSRLTAAVAIYLPTEGQANCDQAVAGCFRPIRTAEQLAAEEREKGILAMIEDSGFSADDGLVWPTVEALYNAGYRK